MERKFRHFLRQVLVVLMSIQLCGCGGSNYAPPSEKEIQQYEEHMKSAIQQEGRQPRQPDEQ